MNLSFPGTLLLVALLASCARLGDGPTAAPAASPSPSPATSPIRFLLDETYTVGQRIQVRIQNVGEETYEYNAEYQACDLRYREASGREFIIPPGTHCDLIFMQPIAPGETATLFRWDLDECVRDEWGCVESRPLPPGSYVVSGRFRPVGAGEPARAEATFRIVEPS